MPLQFGTDLFIKSAFDGKQGIIKIIALSILAMMTIILIYKFIKHSLVKR